MRYGSLTYQEIAGLADNGAVAVVPMGCTEQQGPHLPVDFDSWFAEAITLASAERARIDHGVKSIVLPVIPIGPTPEHKSFGAGYLDLPRQLHDALVTAVLDSLAAQRFRAVVIWRGCGGHDLRQVAASYAKRQAEMAVHLPELPFREIWDTVGDPAVPGGHADSFTTSIMLFRRPSLVHKDRIPPPSRTPDWGDPNLDFGAYSDSGVIGDPNHASPELGERLWQASVAWASRYLATVAEATTHDAVLQTVKQAKPANLETVELFDVFRGQGVPEGQKSLAYAFTYRAVEKTLTEAEVNSAHEKAVESLKQKLSAVIR